MKIRAADADEKLGYNCVKPAAFQPVPKEPASQFRISRFPVELPIGVEQRGEKIQIADRRFADGQLFAGRDSRRGRGREVPATAAGAAGFRTWFTSASAWASGIDAEMFTAGPFGVICTVCAN